MKPSLVCLAFLVAPLLLAGCSSDRREAELPAPNLVDKDVPRLGASSEERFGSRRMQAPQPTAAVPSFAYEMPPGWEKAGARQFRDVNLTAPGGIQVWVTLMGPGAGGVLPNLNRWHGQLGLPPITQDDVDVLPRTILLGAEALHVDITGADGSQRLIATALFAADRSVFVRMQGPTEAVGAQLDALAGFEASLRDSSGGEAGHGDPGAAAPDAPSSADGAGGFGWKVPDGWKSIGPGSMKLFEFQAGDARCWLSELAGDGGGLTGNVQRWCGQVGHAPMTAEEIAALPKIEVLGRPSTYVELAADTETLLGVIVPLDGRTLFVRMAGPSDAVQSHKTAFEAFCASLTVKE